MLYRNDIIEVFRAKVLEALDAAALETMGGYVARVNNGKGATDADLPRLFKAIDEHVEILAARVDCPLYLRRDDVI